MPNLYNDLVLKLYVTGLSIDFTYLEKVKYGKDSNRDEFLLVHKRLYLVLIVLGFIIEDLPLRRLCVEAASVCEFTTNNSMLILKKLPNASINDVECSADKLKIYNDLRSLLGNLKSAVKINKKLIEFYEISSVKGYENLEYLNRTRVINTELTPIIYPGIERCTKKMREEQQHQQQENGTNDIPPPPDFHRVLQNNENFLKDISQRFKLLCDPLQDSKVPTRVSFYEIRQVFMNQLNGSKDFHFKPNDLYFAMPSITVEQILNYHKYLFDEITKLTNQNEKTLFFDFNDNKKNDEFYEPTKCDLATAYNQGVINVLDLTRDNNTMYDIENIMFYAIHLKKLHCTLSEFPQINLNCTIPTSLQLQNTFHYVVFRGFPSIVRVVGMRVMLLESFSLLDAMNEKFDFDIVKYSKRIKIGAESQRMLDLTVIECSNGNESMTEISMDIDVKQEKPEIKKRVPKKSHRREAQSNVIDSTTTASIVKVENVNPSVFVTKELIRRSHTKQPKIVHTFDGTKNMDLLLLLLQNQLSLIINDKVEIDMLKSCLPLLIHGEKSNGKVSKVVMKILKFRGHKSDIMKLILDEEKLITVSLPFYVDGFLKIFIEIIDSIAYSNISRDEASIKTKVLITITGKLLVENLMSSCILVVRGSSVKESNIKMCSTKVSIPKNRRDRTKRISKKPAIVQEPVAVPVAVTLVNENDGQKECNEVKVVQSNNNNDVGIIMNYNNDQYGKLNEEIVDVQMPLIEQQDEHYDMDVEHFEAINYCNVVLTSTPTKEIAVEDCVDLKVYFPFRNVDDTNTTSMTIEESQIVMPTVDHIMDNEIKPEPVLNEPMCLINTFEHNESKSANELMNLPMSLIKPEQNLLPNVIGCHLEVPIVFPNTNYVENDCDKLYNCCIDLTNDNDQSLTNFAHDIGALRTYSKYDASKLLHEQQLPVKCNVSNSVDFESMMPCVQLMIPENMRNNEIERSRWCCEMKKHDVKIIEKDQRRAGPACQNKSKRKSRESNQGRPLLHSVNRNSNMKKIKKCSVLLLNCLQDIQLDKLRTNEDVQMKKVNLKLPPSVS